MASEKASMSLMDRAILELEEIWQEERTFWSNYLDKDGNFCFVFGSAVHTDVSIVFQPDGTPKAYIAHESNGRVYITAKEQEALAEQLEWKATSLLRPGPSQDVVRFACFVLCFLNGLLPYNQAIAVLNANRYLAALETASRYQSTLVKEISTLQQSEKDQLNKIKQDEQKLQKLIAAEVAKAEAEKAKAEAVRASTSSTPSTSVEIDAAPILKPTVLTMGALEKAEANANASAARHIAEASSSSSSVDAPPAPAKKQPTLVLKSKKGAKRTLLMGTGLVAPKVNPSSMASPSKAKHSKVPKSYNIAEISESTEQQIEVGKSYNIAEESERTEQQIQQRKKAIEQWKARREALEHALLLLASREDFQHASQQGTSLRYENEKRRTAELMRRKAEEQRAEAQARALEAIQQQKRHDDFRKTILDKLAGPMDSATEAILRRKPSESEQEFVEYLANVYSFSSHMILWSKAELTGIPAIITGEHFEQVQEINFSENRLSIIPPGLLSLPNLRRLFLHTNKIRKLPMLQAATMTLSKSLQLLDLHDNDLFDLDVSGLEELQILDCEKNDLREFPIGFEQCEKLQHLNLSRNRIKIVPIALGSFANKKLSYLRLRCNPITNLPAHVYLKGLRATMDFLVEHGASSLISATSRSDSLISDLEKRLLFNPFLSDVVLQPSDDAKTSFPAHTCILSARCKSIVPVLNNLPPLPEEPYRAGTPKNINIVVMKAAADELRMLLEYIYCDRFTAPALELVQVNLEMGAVAVSEATNINEQMLKARKTQLERYVEVAKRFDLPHLKMLIQMALSYPHEETSSTFDNDMKSLWTSASHTSDVSFRALSFPGSPLVHAHKAVMASRSEFLKSLLTGGMIESTQREVGLVDLSPEVLRSIVEFCYTDDVETLDPETVLELLTTSKLYGLKRLQAIVEGVVGYSLDVNNVSSLLSLAWAQSLKALARACKFFILSNWSTVTSKSDWKDVEEEIRKKLTATAKKWKVI